MGVFDLLFKGNTAVYRGGQLSNMSVKLVEPSIGRIVELQITQKNDKLAKMYMDLLITYAENLEQFGVRWKVKDKTIQLIFNDEDMAEDVRQIWKR